MENCSEKAVAPSPTTVDSGIAKETIVESSSPKESRSDMDGQDPEPIIHHNDEDSHIKGKDSVVTTIAGQNPKISNNFGTDLYGPWMLVKLPARRRNINKESINIDGNHEVKDV
ncbi:UDP-N-acetylmuramoyl-L-alanine--D-glutamate ligase [Sesbania bispinosa]|nr:UDP-N-acetylmuramoyl-L-alanine--D-glutamate ligase [Sesbania bispinosa]